MGDTFFLIVDGEAKATKKSAGREETVFEYRNSGDYFGELSLIDEKPQPRKASVIATVDFIHSDTFYSCFNRQKLIQTPLWWWCH